MTYSKKTNSWLRILWSDYFVVIAMICSKGTIFESNEYYVQTTKLEANVLKPNGGYSRQTMAGYDKWDGKSKQSHLYKQDGKGGYTEVSRKDIQKPSSKVK